MKLSIIIPYYQTYELTEKLLKVLQPQICDGVEVILVDDGCNEIRLDSFEKIKIIHLNKNYGASYAWNRGIEQATGEYIGFIDSDDMIENNYIAVLLYAINNIGTDEIVFDYWSTLYNGKELLRKRPIGRSIWKGIYKRTIVPMFDEKAKCYTDVPFKGKLDATEHTKSFLDIPLYHYKTLRPGSITWKMETGGFKREEFGKYEPRN